MTREEVSDIRKVLNREEGKSPVEHSSEGEYTVKCKIHYSTVFSVLLPA